LTIIRVGPGVPAEKAQQAKAEGVRKIMGVQVDFELILIYYYLQYVNRFVYINILVSTNS
jgi:hypothetical protein